MQQQYGQGGGYNPYGMATGALGSIAGGVGSLFAQNPANASSPYLNQLTNSLQGIYSPWMGQQAQQALNPYLQGGQWAQGGLQNATSNMINNPTGLFNSWGSTYQSSPGYNWQVGQAGEAANNAAAAGGMAGSQAEQQNIAGTVNQLANQDYWQYINNAQNLYGQGYQGLQNQYGIGAQAANNMYGVGAQAANQYAGNYGNALTNQAGLAYNGAINRNESMQGGLGALGAGIGGIASLAGLF